MNDEMNEEVVFPSCDPADCASCGGCGSFEDGLPQTITLTMEDDSIVECAVLAVYPVDEKWYIALIPLDENGDPAANEVYIYGFAQAENGAPVLSNIVDDDEYDAASQAFDQMLEEAQTVAFADPE